MANPLELAHALLSEPKEEHKIDDILDRPEVKEEIEKPREIDRTHDVPYLAGSSKDGGTTYIDKRIPAKIKVGDKEIDPSKYLNIHEQTEHALMTIGKLPYKKAHAIATDHEKKAVTADKIDWKKYEEVLDGYIDETEHEDAKKPPKDLYLKPYPHGKQHSLQEAASKEDEPIKDHHIIIMALNHKWQHT